MCIVADICSMCAVDRVCVVWLREDHPGVEVMYVESTVGASFVTLLTILDDFVV